MKKIRRRPRLNGRTDRGSALLVSLMVMVGLSLLGLAFVAISETESTIAKNQSQALQTLTVAEAGAKMVVEWFQDPTWAIAHAGMPTNTACASFGSTPCSASGTPGTFMKTVRIVGTYTGVYKPRATTMICDRPYRPGSDDRFYGNEQNADLILNATTVGQARMNTINNVLLGPNADDKVAGEVTEIRIFAPPIVGGTLVNGFWEGGQRYGVATISVTAQQFRDPVAKTGVIASHSVRMVVGELPLPIPAGPIQGNASVSFGGNFYVHWGMETSRLTLDPSRFLTSLPWANAYERPHFEHGYEPGTGVAKIIISSRGSGYTTANPPTVTIAGGGGAGATATAVVTSGGVSSVNVTAPGTGYNRSPGAGPTITFTCAAPCTGSGAAGYASIGHEIYYTTGGTYDGQDFFRETLDKSVDDPWYGARAAGDNLRDGPGGGPQLYTYTYDRDETDPNSPSYFFQYQDHNAYPHYKAVVFPAIRYDYWKRIAEQGRGYKGLYYFSYDAGSGDFQKFGTGAAQPAVYWVNTIAGANLGPGVYFFDTTNRQNPQSLTGAARTAALTPALSWNAAGFNRDFLMQGFVYFNTNSFGTTGGGSALTPVNVNFPGEPFRDIGYPIWCTGPGAPIAGCTAANVWSDCTNNVPCRQSAGDGSWQCQDLNNNQKCDIVVMSSPAWNSYDPAATGHAAGDAWIPKTWKSVAQATAEYGAPCTVPAATYNGTNAAATDCSEPHEPYLNLIYPATALASPSDPADVQVGWEDPSAQTYRPKRVDPASAFPPGTPVTCVGVPSTDDCVSNAYDVDGAVVELEVMLYGILYNEGQYGAQGNVHYFGSVLIQDDVNGIGTADVWFDEKLIKGSWAPPKMPRVIVFSEQTDEQSQ